MTNPASPWALRGDAHAPPHRARTPRAKGRAPVFSRRSEPLSDEAGITPRGTAAKFRLAEHHYGRRRCMASRVAMSPQPTRLLVRILAAIFPPASLSLAGAGRAAASRNRAARRRRRSSSQEMWVERSRMQVPLPPRIPIGAFLLWGRRAPKPDGEGPRGPQAPPAREDHPHPPGDPFCLSGAREASHSVVGDGLGNRDAPCGRNTCPTGRRPGTSAGSSWVRERGCDSGRR
jgi:hypothetical protein